jgi:hypothetical protein
MRLPIRMLSVLLLSSAALPSLAAGSETQTAPLCRVLDRAVDRCAGDRLSADTRASCDRIEQGYQAVCGTMGTIRVEASADGIALNLLAQDYEIVDLEEPWEGHIVVGPGALEKPRLMALVARAYRAGLAVAIVGATQEEANLFDSLIEGVQVASCRPSEGALEIALYGLQRNPRQDPPVVNRYCLPELEYLNKRGTEAARRWLRTLFAQPRPQAPETTPGDAADSVNLESLSQQIHCSDFVFQIQGQVQQDTFFTSLRSFSQQTDYYYVTNFAQFFPSVSNYSLETLVFRPFAGPDFEFDSLYGTRILFSEPSTVTQAVSQYTNSRSTTVSGGVGFGSDGFNVEASASVTVGTETTVVVPPVTIRNLSNLDTAGTLWNFRPVSAEPSTRFDFATSFVWLVRRDLYPDGGEGAGELLSLFQSAIIPDGQPRLRTNGQCLYPLPFPTWEVDAPVIARVEPATAKRGGGSFLIHGEQMYPSIVSDVLLGGNPLPQANYVTIDDAQIRVVVPGGQRLGATPVQVNTLFNGQTLPSNNNVEVNVRP